jgi:hypothetical protein
MPLYYAVSFIQVTMLFINNGLVSYDAKENRLKVNASLPPRDTGGARLQLSTLIITTSEQIWIVQPNE